MPQQRLLAVIGNRSQVLPQQPEFSSFKFLLVHFWCSCSAEWDAWKKRPTSRQRAFYSMCPKCGFSKAFDFRL